ncbi:MAG: ABC transporter ATP-binding protein [Deltaproteobacteria bacterium]|nr:ABC transporter ATP-binding protein [Deltaproteobacteria bacterium]
MNSNLVLQCNQLTKRYKSGDQYITALDRVDLTLRRGETCAVVGPSGSGKTTLLSLAAGLDRASSGSVLLQGQDLSFLDEDALALLRGKSVGFVFQSYQLIPSLTALENVLLPVEIRGYADRDGAKELLAHVGLGERFHHYPSQLSGGEQQRVALARAFINKPAILFADEPTGSLDAENAERALSAMFELNTRYHVALLLVTHDDELARRAQRIIRLKSGRIVGDD